MPTPRNWDGLDAAYRKRLLRKGITKADYDSGKNLQAARGQASTKEGAKSGEAKAAALRRRFPSLPGKSTVRAWKRRAVVGLNVSQSDWQSALRSVGPNFDAVKEQVRRLEAAQKNYRELGQPHYTRGRANKRPATFDPHTPVGGGAIPEALQSPFTLGDGGNFTDEDYDDYRKDEQEVELEDYWKDFDAPIEWGESWGYYH
jgi:hypothetical protein